MSNGVEYADRLNKIALTSCNEEHRLKAFLTCPTKEVRKVFLLSER